MLLALFSHSETKQTRHGHGGEHRGQNADGERHGEAADRTGAEPEHDDRGSERRELAVEDGDEGALEALASIAAIGDLPLRSSSRMRS